MNWDALGAIAELLAAIAVIATLAYLAAQVRFAKTAASDLSRISRADAVRETLQTIANDPHLRKNWLNSAGLEEQYEALSLHLNTDIDGAFQLDFMCQSWIWLHWGQYSSTTTDDDLEELRGLIGRFYSNPPMSIVWSESPFEKGLVEPDFIEFVNDAIQKHRSSEGTR